MQMTQIRSPHATVLQILVLLEFSGRWTGKFRSFKSCILPEFHSPSTGKTAPEKNRPYTVWTATLRSICWNFPVNLKQCSVKANTCLNRKEYKTIFYLNEGRLYSL